MQKFITYLLAGSLALESLLMPASALAQTATSTTSVDAMILQLEAQIKTLQTQIEALRAAREQVVKTIGETSQLIRQLRQGMSGEDVRLLQVLLAADSDIYPEALVTGFFGGLTAKAVRKFQHKHGLPQVGHVGPLTLEELRRLLKDFDLDEDEDDDEDYDDDDDNDRIRGGGRRILCYRIMSGINVPPGWARKDREGKHFIKKCGDFATSTPPVAPPTSDTTAPVIREIEVDDRTSTGAKIEWKTNEFATGHVWYGTSTPLAINSGSNVTSKEHSVTLIGLTASTTYQFVAVSKDLSGNTATSTQQSFTTR